MSHPRNLRVGVVGCGAISRNHLEAFAAVEHAEVVAVCDVDLSRAEQVARRHGVPAHFRNVADLIDHGVDLISVCTPHPTHEEVVLAAAAAGVHVLCEKPIATDLPAAERMLRACDDAGVRLGVLFQRRFWPAAREVRAALADPRIGEAVLGQCSVLLHREHSYYSRDAWRGTWASDGGGVLMTQAIHYIDLLQWLMGDVAEVYGRVNTFKHGDHIEVEDSAVATLVFTSGALATIQATTAASPALGAKVQITGVNGGTVSLTEFPEGSDGRIDILAADGKIESAPAHPLGTDPDVDLATINGQLIPHHTAQVRDFVEALRTGAEPAVTGADGTRVLRTIIAIYQAARSGRPVHLAPAPTRVSVPDSLQAQESPHPVH